MTDYNQHFSMNHLHCMQQESFPDNLEGDQEKYSRFWIFYCRGGCPAVERLKEKNARILRKRGLYIVNLQSCVRLQKGQQ